MLLVPCFLILTPITADEALDIDSILTNEKRRFKVSGEAFILRHLFPYPYLSFQ